MLKITLLVGRDDLKVEDVIFAVLYASKLNPILVNDEDGLGTRFKSKRKMKDKTQVECYNCHKMEHYVMECLENKNRERKSSSANMVEGNHDEDRELYMISHSSDLQEDSTAGKDIDSD